MMDLSGQKFGRWDVLGPAPKRGKHIMWRCRCACGSEKDVLGFSLKAGKSSDCGCERIKATAIRTTKHGMWKHPAYGSWRAMNHRCKYPSDPSYYLYGARGIKVCAEWQAFEGFWRDMGSSWFDGGTIDRLDNDKGYEPGNCQWATHKHQANNRRVHRLIETPAGMMNLTQASERFGIRRETLDARLTYGFAQDEAISQKVRSRNRKIQTPEGPMLIADASKRFGISVVTINARIRRGWSAVDLLKPV